MSWLARALATGFKGESKVVSVVTLRGMLAPPARGPRKLLNAERAQAWIDRAFSKPADAVALSISSPGGSPAATQALVAAIRERAEETKIPVWSFGTDVAASGGYWLLSAAADECYALETTLVGSIGVLSASFAPVDAMKKLGIERRMMRAGSCKAGSDPFSPLSEAEKERTQSILDDLHSTFRSAVERSRGEKIEKATARLLLSPEGEGDEGERESRRRLAGLVPDIYTGRVFTGRQAEALGLVDGVGGLREICRRKLSGGGADGKVKRVVFVDCGERVSAGGGWGPFSSFDASAISSSVSGVPARMLDELEERAAYARFGL